MVSTSHFPFSHRTPRKQGKRRTGFVFFSQVLLHLVLPFWVCWMLRGVRGPVCWCRVSSLESEERCCAVLERMPCFDYAHSEQRALSWLSLVLLLFSWQFWRFVSFCSPSDLAPVALKHMEGVAFGAEETLYICRAL